MKNKVVMTAFFFFVLIGISSAGDNDLEKILLKNDSGKLIAIYGCFTKPCSFQPGFNNLFFFNDDILNIAFNYIGRTGDKTFDLVKLDYRASTTIHVYFTPNDTLSVYPSVKEISKCKNEKIPIYLKMIEMKGNALKFQIILPPCLADAKP